MNNTINYYNKNANEYYADTINADMQSIRKTFTNKLIPGAEILDFGCGSGRDTKVFLQEGFKVIATDGSARLCKLASSYTGIKVKELLFEELNDVDCYDGIWTCSSILHLPYKEMKKVVQLMERALHNNGIIYTSFKYGDFEGVRNGRWFTDMTENKMNVMLRDIRGIKSEKKWITADCRQGREEERWLNVILRKDK